MYKVRTQLLIPDDHGEDVLTSLEAKFQTLENCLTYVTSKMKTGKIQAVRIIEVIVNG